MTATTPAIHNREAEKPTQAGVIVYVNQMEATAARVSGKQTRRHRLHGIKQKPHAKPAVPSAPAIAINNEKMPLKWTTVKRFKVFGSALLLVSFGMQMYKSRAGASETAKTQAAELDGRAAIKALGYESLYYSEKVATGQEDGFQLYAATMERSVGETRNDCRTLMKRVRQ
jgi:hypothetical protein